MECRAGCGACCIAPSIKTAIPGMPEGKPAGVRCIQLDNDYRCRLFSSSERPGVCSQFKAEHAVCGDSRGQAIQLLMALEIATET
jgi:uncharacterized protein